MIATAHALIGAVIAAKVQNPALAIPLALASHVAADLFPHWDTATDKHKGKPKRKILIDTLVDIGAGFALSAFLLLFLFPSTNLIYASLIIVVSQLPDWLMGLYYFFGIKQMKWAYDFGKATNTELDKPWGIIGQAIVVFLLILTAVLL